MNTIRFATEQDILSLQSFLKKADLQTDGVEKLYDHFLLQENEEGKMTATVGLEPMERSGLLRSLVLTPATTENDLFALFEGAFQLAQQKGMETVYLVSNRRSTSTLFQVLGFQEMEEVEAVEVLSGCEHGAQIVASREENFLFMKRSLDVSTELPTSE